MKEFINVFKENLTKRYFCFEGRTSRKEFLQYIVVPIAVSVLVSILCSIVPKMSLIFNIILGLFNLAILLPNLSIVARRLHDIGKSGFFQLVSLIPCIGFLILIYFLIQKGATEANAYGEVPACACNCDCENKTE